MLKMEIEIDYSVLCKSKIRMLDLCTFELQQPYVVLDCCSVIPINQSINMLIFRSCSINYVAASPLW